MHTRSSCEGEFHVRGDGGEVSLSSEKTVEIATDLEVSIVITKKEAWMKQSC
jgi:hypothetical protein